MVIDPRGNATAYEYNQRGQVTKVQHQDGTYTQNAYNPLPDGTRTGPDGTLAWTADENHPNAWMNGHESERTRYTYDEYKRVRSATKPYAASAALNDYSPCGMGRARFPTPPAPSIAPRRPPARSPIPITTRTSAGKA